MLLSEQPIELQNITTKHDSFDVYNIEVSGVHTYHVGNLGILVHNKAAGKGFTKGGGKTGRKINTNRQQVAEQKIQELKQQKANAATKAEKRGIQRQIDHQRRNLQKSEEHARRGQGF